jgi:predicted regulator of Ras-like GTPase activity (Roadblock/LC7/MglB family)
VGVFKEVLREISKRVEGTRAISIIGLDGIAVESINDWGVPLDVIGAELGGFVKNIRVSNTELNAGEVQQFSVVTDKYVIFLSQITPEYFMLLVLSPDGNYGRGRFELARAKQQLREELS